MYVIIFKSFVFLSNKTYYVCNICIELILKMCVELEFSIEIGKKKEVFKRKLIHNIK